jgi:hypothetical protein
VSFKQGGSPTSTDRCRRGVVRLIPALAVGASLVAAAPAGAATLTVDYAKGTIAFQAAAGEANNLKVDTDKSSFRIADSSAPTVSLSQIAGVVNGCNAAGAGVFKCPSHGLSRATIDLGDGHDTVDVTAAGLPTTVTGGVGGKDVELGAGDDSVSLRNGVRDHISCGDGDDTVVADAQDDVSDDCEHVDLSGGVSVDGTNGSSGGDDQQDDGAATGTGSDDSSPVAGGSLTAPIGIVLPSPSRPVTLPDPHTAVVRLGCAATMTAGCHGEVYLELPAQARQPHGAKRVIAARGHFVAQQHRRIGKGRFKLAAGQSADVPVRIMLRGHYSQVSRRRTRRAVLKVVVRDSTGKVVGVETRVVTLKLSNKWSRRSRGRTK